MRRRLLAARAAIAAAWLAGVVASLAGGAAHAQHGGDEEVPFITTPDRVTLAMLELAGVGPADRVVDLGSGDGRIVVTAAKRFGARGLGVELVPDLVAQSRENARKAGVADRAEFRVQDLFDTDLAAFSVITMYLLPEVNLKLRPRLLALAPGTRIVSHDWDMGDWAPDRSLTLEVPEKTIGREKRSRLMLWVVPARLQGLWCGPGGVALRLQQAFQQVTGTLGDAADQAGIVGRIDGVVLRLLGASGGRSPAGWTLQAEADGTLSVRQTDPVGPLGQAGPLRPGQRLRPATAASCATG